MGDSVSVQLVMPPFEMKPGLEEDDGLCERT